MIVTDATATEKRPLTDRQRDVLAKIVEHWGATGNYSTVRWLCAELFVESPNGISGHLKALNDKGFIEWRPTKAGAGIRASRNMVVPDLVAAARAAADAYLEGMK